MKDIWKVNKESDFFKKPVSNHNNNTFVIIWIFNRDLLFGNLDSYFHSSNSSVDANSRFLQIVKSVHFTQNQLFQIETLELQYQLSNSFSKGGDEKLEVLNSRTHTLKSHKKMSVLLSVKQTFQQPTLINFATNWLLKPSQINFYYALKLLNFAINHY